MIERAPVAILNMGVQMVAKMKEFGKWLVTILIILSGPFWVFFLVLGYCVRGISYCVYYLAMDLHKSLWHNLGGEHESKN